MILATLLNLHFSRVYVHGSREKLHKTTKISFYNNKIYVGKMIYLINNECIRLGCARLFKVFEAFYKLINFP